MSFPVNPQNIKGCTFQQTGCLTHCLLIPRILAIVHLTLSIYLRLRHTFKKSIYLSNYLYITEVHGNLLP